MTLPAAASSKSYALPIILGVSALGLIWYLFFGKKG